jgi:hypothetical protein
MAQAQYVIRETKKTRNSRKPWLREFKALRAGTGEICVVLLSPSFEV